MLCAVVINLFWFTISKFVCFKTISASHYILLKLMYFGIWWPHWSWRLDLTSSIPSFMWSKTFFLHIRVSVSHHLARSSIFCHRVTSNNSGGQPYIVYVETLVHCIDAKISGHKGFLFDYDCKTHKGTNFGLLVLVMLYFWQIFKSSF